MATIHAGADGATADNGNLRKGDGIMVWERRVAASFMKRGPGALTGTVVAHHHRLRCHRRCRYG